MRVVVLIAIMAMLLKDLRFVPDVYVLRGFTQGLCLLAGTYWLARFGDQVRWRSYMFPFAYLGVALLVSVLSEEPVLACLQLASLAALWVGLLARTATALDDASDIAADLRLVAIACGAACAVSVILALVRPDLAYLTGTWSGSVRLRGVFGMPSYLATVGSLAAGLALFIKGGVVLRVVLFTLGAACVFESGTRTQWVAAPLAALLVGMWVWRSRRLKIAVAVFISAVSLIGVGVLSGSTTARGIAEHLVRAESLQNLSGRTVLWRSALERFSQNPWLGYGFSRGDDVFRRHGEQFDDTYSPFTTRGEDIRYSMHSGYLTALVETGPLGMLLYLGAVVAALVQLLRRHERALSPPLYAFIMLVLVNFTESVIVGAATFTSTLSWYLIFVALSVRPAGERAASGAPEPLVSPLSRRCSAAGGSWTDSRLRGVTRRS